MNNKFFEWAGGCYSNSLFYVCSLKHWNRVFGILFVTIICYFDWYLGIQRRSQGNTCTTIFLCHSWYYWNDTLVLIKISNNLWNVIFKVKKTFITVLPRKLI